MLDRTPSTRTILAPESIGLEPSGEKGERRRVMLTILAYA